MLDIGRRRDQRGGSIAVVLDLPFSALGHITARFDNRGCLDQRQPHHGAQAVFGLQQVLGHLGLDRLDRRLRAYPHIEIHEHIPIDFFEIGIVVVVANKAVDPGIKVVLLHAARHRQANAARLLLSVSRAVKEEAHTRRRIAQRRNAGTDRQARKASIATEHRGRQIVLRAQARGAIVVATAVRHERCTRKPQAIGERLVVDIEGCRMERRGRQIRAAVECRDANRDVVAGKIDVQVTGDTRIPKGIAIDICQIESRRPIDIPHATGSLKRTGQVPGAGRGIAAKDLNRARQQLNCAAKHRGRTEQNAGLALFVATVVAVEKDGIVALRIAIKIVDAVNGDKAAVIALDLAIGRIPGTTSRIRILGRGKRSTFGTRCHEAQARTALKGIGPHFDAIGRPKEHALQVLAVLKRVATDLARMLAQVDKHKLRIAREGVRCDGVHFELLAVVRMQRAVKGRRQIAVFVAGSRQQDYLAVVVVIQVSLLRQAHLNNARIGCAGSSLMLLNIRNLLVRSAHNGLHRAARKTTVLERHLVTKPRHEHQRIDRGVARKGALHDVVGDLHQGNVGARIEHTVQIAFHLRVQAIYQALRVHKLHLGIARRGEVHTVGIVQLARMLDDKIEQDAIVNHKGAVPQIAHVDLGQLALFRRM